MSKKYELVLATGESQQFSRKDTAIAAGERIGGAFQVLSPAGAVVHEKHVAPTKGTKKSEARKATIKAKATEEQAGSPVVYTQGAKRFFPAMGRAAVIVAESMGLTATADNATRVVLVQGSKADFKKFERVITAAWAEAWDAFKGWKADNREARAKQWLTNDGKRAMYLQEDAFLAGAVLEAADVK